ncbi:MAG: exo-alpha-sialidase [Ruminococcaceae bacterium]|nr:exo-alpha-sialidase [Oscillospiraceae bacterium]
MNIKLLGSPSTVMHNPEARFGTFGYFAWPTAKRLQDGRIAVAASGFRIVHVCPFGKAVICFSRDEGETYSLPAVVTDTPLDDRDGGLCPFDEKGLIFTSFTNRHIFTDGDEGPIRKYFYAYLDTLTREDEEKYLCANFKISLDGGTTFGEFKKSPITSPHGPIQLKNGKILWVGMRYFDGKSDSHEWRVDSYILDPTSGKMEKIGEIDPIYVDGERKKCCEPYTAELSDGTLICHIRVEPEFSLFQTESHDGGYTWTAPHRILPPHGGAPSHIIEHSSGVMIATYSYRESPYGIKVMLSRDKGQSWSEGEYLYSNTVSYDLGYPTSVELSDGSIATVFYATEDTSVGAKIMQQKWRLDI